MDNEELKKLQTTVIDVLLSGVVAAFTTGISSEEDKRSIEYLAGLVSDGILDKLPIHQLREISDCARTIDRQKDLYILESTRFALWLYKVINEEVLNSSN